MINYPPSVIDTPALWPDKLPSFDGMRFYAVTLAPNGHALTTPKPVSLTRALTLLRLFAQAEYLQWYWDASHTTPAPDVGQGFQDDLLLLACGQCVTHHHAGCVDVLMAVPTAK
jgi:hypothetical protein